MRFFCTLSILFILPIAASAYEFPPLHTTIADFADDGDPYLVEESGSHIGSGSYLFQHTRCADGEAYFAYALPVHPGLEVVHVAFEESGECRVTADGVLLLDEGKAGIGAVTARQFTLTDPALWADGEIRFEFRDSHPADGGGPRIPWLECGATTRYREKLYKVEPGTRRIVWSIGAWDGNPAEFSGSLREWTHQGNDSDGPVIRDDARLLRGNRRLRLNWVNDRTPGMMQILILGYRGTGSIDVGADGSIELNSVITGLEALDYDITADLPPLGETATVEVEGTDYIDFVALVEVSPGGDTLEESRIAFGGTQDAVDFGKVMNNTLFWFLAGHYDHTGFMDASPVGGHWRGQYWPIDIATALRELVGWGYLDQAERVAELVAEVAWAGHATNRSGSSDNTAGHMIIIDMINIMERRGWAPDVVDVLWPRAVGYLDGACGQVDESPFGLIRGSNWENAGNLKDGGCYALSTNSGLHYALAYAADAAESLGDGDRAATYRTYAAKVRESILEHLVWKEDFDYGTGLVAPAGTFRYGINSEGEFFRNQLAGWSWAGWIGTNIFGLVDADTEFRVLMDPTEDFRHHIRMAPGGMGMAGLSGGYEGELDWAVSVALSDKPDDLGVLAGMLLDGQDHREDRGSVVCELSRWALGSGGGTEDTNLVGTGVFLSMGRVMAGVDDFLHDGAPLRVLPRLPWDWTRASISGWPVQFADGDGNIGHGRLTYRLRRDDQSAEIRIALMGSAAVGAPVAVRLGPFPLGTMSLGARIDNRPVDCRLEKSGRAAWGWVDVAGGAERVVRMEVR